MQDANLTRLKAVIALFGLGLNDVAKAGQVSRPYVSRVISGGLKPSTRFLRGVEANLHHLVEHRHGQVFQIKVASVEAAEGVLGEPRLSFSMGEMLPRDRQRAGYN